MNRLFIRLISLLIPLGTLAQPSTEFKATSRSATGSGVEEATPRRLQATESPVYVKVYGVYGLLTPGVQVTNSLLQSPDGSVFTFKTTSKGLGAGPRAGVGLGFIVSDFINVGIDADILFGDAVKSGDTFVDGSNTYTSSSTITLKVLSVIPNITFKALSRPGYYIYNRLGLVGGMVQEYKQINSGGNQPKVGVGSTTVSTTDYTKNSMALGYQVALGIQFRLSQKLRGFAELVAYNQSFRPQRQEVSTVNTFGTTVRKTSSVTEYSQQGTIVGASGTQTGQQESFNVPMNSVGASVGITFRF